MRREHIAQYCWHGHMHTRWSFGCYAYIVFTYSYTVASVPDPEHPGTERFSNST